MHKILIVYESFHHGNTKKLLEIAKQEVAFDMLPVRDATSCDLSGYDCICAASGIYHAKPHKNIMEFMQNNAGTLSKKKVLLAITSGSQSQKSMDDFSVQQKLLGIDVAAAFRSKGFDTFGPFRLIGGINKGHPNQKDADAFVRFLREYA